MLKVSDKPTWSPLWLAAGACQCITGIKLRLRVLQYWHQIAFAHAAVHVTASGTPDSPLSIGIGRPSDDPYSDPSHWC